MAYKKYVSENKEYYEVYVNGFDSAGRRIQKRKRKIESLKKALAVEFEFKHELAQAKENAVPVRFHEWFDVVLGRFKLEFTKSTIQWYDGLIRKWAFPHWENKEIHSITKSDVYELVFVQSKGIKTEWNRRNLLKALKRVMQLAVDEGIIERNPCIGITIRVPESKLQVLTPIEGKRLLLEAKMLGHRFYPIWALGLLTGMRSGEMAALKWTDIDFENKLISVNKQWTSKAGITSTKSKGVRKVPISEELRRFLVDLKLERGEEITVLPHLIEWQNGEQARVLREFCAGIGITQIRFHDLRASFITNLLAKGESLGRVMAIVGHGDIKTTNMYFRKSGVEVIGGTDKLDFTVPKVESAVARLRLVE